MRSGRLRHKVTVEQVTETIDEFGQAIKSWSTFAQPFAAIEPVSGREYFAAQQVDSEVTVKITMRYLSGLTTKMRISWGGKIYNIQSIIDPAERTAMQTLMCSEGLNDG